MMGTVVSAASEIGFTRRASLYLAVLTVAALACPGAASATPTVSFKARAVPISGHPKTGNVLGAGAALSVEYSIGGAEYDGTPPPLIGLNLNIAHGWKVHDTGFTTCPPSTLEVEREPAKCPKASIAGPTGSFRGFVSFGSTRVEEDGTIAPFYTPGAGLDLFLFGHSPTIIELNASGRYTSFKGTGTRGAELDFTSPLIATVPGAPYGSVTNIAYQFGTATKTGKKEVDYLKLPKSCPAGGFAFTSEAVFAKEDALPEEVPGEVVTSVYNAPCPK